MDIPTIHPPRLNQGDTIAVVAPAGPIEKQEGLDKGISVLEKMGFQVRYEERIFQSSRYLAGSDPERAEELMQAFDDRQVHAIIGLRGGYGCSRLIPWFHEKRFRPNPKLFMGFSDLTTLHMFFRRRFGWVTVHGPMAMTLGNIDAEQESHLFSMWTDPGYRPILNFPGLECWHPGAAEGVLAGGCLSLITASLETSYEIRTEGKILFLEDQGEPPYRLDRMLTHLKLAGKLNGVSGLLLGEFRDCEPANSNYTAKDVLHEVLDDCNVPILANFPAGHGSTNWAIPLGARVRLDSDAGTLQFLDAAVC
jgi:muramoyltetrapeptide carboxypeptidase